MALGKGEFPEEKKQDLVCFQFLGVGNFDFKGEVWAKNYNEAVEQIIKLDFEIKEVPNINELDTFYQVEEV